VTSDDPHYLLEHVRSALAVDDRVHELDVDVLVTDDAIVVTGTVATDERLLWIEEILHELCGDRAVRNEVTVLRIDPRPSEERLQC
jgi:osmotically-inducible protein OsmY